MKFTIKPIYLFSKTACIAAEEAQNCPTGNIYLIENEKTGLVYNEAFDAGLLKYDASYQNDQSYSQTFKNHMEIIADLIETKMGNKKLIEIGCGKGQFLELLLSHGGDVIGFDPAYEGYNPSIKRENFNGNHKIRGNGLILRHVLEHIPEPVTFLKKLAKANGGEGLIYIEVPCLDWICSRGAWFDIFYEHVNYFRLSDFSRIFKNVIHSSRTFNGQYLSVIADLSSLTEPKRDLADSFYFPPDFGENSTLKNIPDSQNNIVVWGGASKGVIFSLLLARKGLKIDRVIDISPEKQGLYIPGTGLRVMSPKEGLKGLPVGSQIYVMNPNYLEEVSSMVGPNFECKGPGDE